MKLDFDETPEAGFSSKCCHRGAVFALRIVLANPGAYIEASETLLRLLGNDAVWPPRIIKALVKALELEDDEGETSAIDEKSISIGKLLKQRRGFRTYSEVISHQFSDDPKLIHEALEDNLRRLDPKTLLKKPASRNLVILGKLLNLSPMELRIIEVAQLRSFEPFRNFMRAINGFAPNEAFEVLAKAVDAPLHKLRAALSVSAPLRSLGLVRIDLSPSDMEDFIALDDAGQMFLAEQCRSETEMLRVVLQPSQKPNLVDEDFQHLQKEFSWLKSFLKTASTQQVPGANILFYGLPGTGKSEFARLLAVSAGLDAFDVKSANNEGDSVSGKVRMANFAISQRFLSERHDAMLIFDEIEDVFPDNGMSFAALFGRSRNTAKPDQSKAWLNQQLEHSPVPAIWISNSIEGIDEAYLRRFAFHVEFRTPPKSARERVINRCLDNFNISTALISRLAADDKLSPAQIRQASQFAKLCAGGGNNLDETLLLHAVKSSQSAMGRQPQGIGHVAGNGQCNFAYLNLNSDLPIEKIEQALRRQSSATMCFYGVPGAGKTSLARHLADAIGRPLLVKRASDLLGKYVGESEKLIADMFREASQEGAVLLLDEADSFLRSRQMASHSWEVTQVNELLQQMEAFEGVFVCTTNLMKDVDEAALRRFTFKIRFDALKASQREAMFAEMVMGDPSATLASPIANALRKLESLTPGDFATVQRQESVLGEKYSPNDFLVCLEREHAIKGGGCHKSIGFLG